MSLSGNTIDVLNITKPHTIEYAEHLAKTVSKLSPLIGNMIEFYVCEELNKLDWYGQGRWKRQDPGFPDTVFEGSIYPTPGIEVKTWFPLATEMTARFKDSVSHFKLDQTYVALVVWLPEFIIYGKPKIISVWIGSAKSIAEARDKHYHKPPHYLIFEPEDTTDRTSNLQQTNTNGYKFQGSDELLKEATGFIQKLSNMVMIYDPSKEYQTMMRLLINKYTYRLDTNFAKIDRIKHEGLESFKADVLNHVIHNHTLKEWSRLINDNNENIIDLIKDLM